MKNNKGFTLVEILAVVVLMAIVVTFAFRTYNYVIKTSKNKTLAISTDNIKSTAELYSKENKNISISIRESKLEESLEQLNKLVGISEVKSKVNEMMKYL